MQAITIRSIKLHTVLLPYLAPFETSFGAETDKVAILVELITDNGVTGWGECAIEFWPGYGHETAETAEHILSEFLVPAVIGATVACPSDFPALIKRFRGTIIHAPAWKRPFGTPSPRATTCG